MSYKWFGAALIVASCGAVGFLMAGASLREERSLRQLVNALDFMSCELQFRRTPLPELCLLAASESPGIIGALLKNLSGVMGEQVIPDAQACVRAVLERFQLPGSVEKAFVLLGNTLGRFDMEGQLQGLAAVRSQCRVELDRLSRGREERLRSYQTLGICAGAALAILFV